MILLFEKEIMRQVANFNKVDDRNTNVLDTETKKEGFLMKVDECRFHLFFSPYLCREEKVRAALLIKT